MIAGEIGAWEHRANRRCDQCGGTMESRHGADCVGDGRDATR
uniref:Uncharacterized protein n=1 Tax=Arundo donax TaxID=35708 RepID=A0A0A9AEW1_ARUDO